MEGIINKLYMAEEECSELDASIITLQQTNGARTNSFSDSSRTTAPPFEQLEMELTQKEQQIAKLTVELEAALSRERSSSDRATQAVSLCEAKAAATRRYALELKTKLRDRDSRIGNLEDTVDALSGRVESEVSRGEKLGAQNITLKEHLEKQRKAIELASPDEVKAALLEANARSKALETKLGSISMEHRAAQRKMASELDSRVRAMDTLRSGVESEVQSLKSKNARLYQLIASLVDKLRANGLEIPVEAVAEMGSEDAQASKSYQGEVSATGDNEEEGGDRTGRSKTRNSRSPSPFRRFMGKRAASPSRTSQQTNPINNDSTKMTTNKPGTVEGASVSNPTMSVKPVSFRRFSSQSSNGGTSVQDASSGESGSTGNIGGGGPSSSARSVEGAAPAREASPSAAAARSAREPSPGQGGILPSGGGDGAKANMTDLLQDRRNTSREVAAQKHAARLKAVRTSSRGKWGFSV